MPFSRQIFAVDSCQLTVVSGQLLTGVRTVKSRPQIRNLKSQIRNLSAVPLADTGLLQLPKYRLLEELVFQGSATFKSRVDRTKLAADVGVKRRTD